MGSGEEGGWSREWQRGWSWHSASGSDHLRVFCDSAAALRVLGGEGITTIQRKGWGSAALCGEQARMELKCGSPSHGQWRVSGETGIQRCG